MSSPPNPKSDADQLEAAADQAIAACGGDAREAVKALIVANHYLETDLEKLKAAASMGYAEESLLRRPGRYRLIGKPLVHCSPGRAFSFATKRSPLQSSTSWPSTY